MKKINYYYIIIIILHLSSHHLTHVYVHLTFLHLRPYHLTRVYACLTFLHLSYLVTTSPCHSVIWLIQFNLLHHRVTVLPRHCVTASFDLSTLKSPPLYVCLTFLHLSPHHLTSVYAHFTFLHLSYRVTASPCHHVIWFTVPPHHCITTSPCHHII